MPVTFLCLWEPGSYEPWWCCRIPDGGPHYFVLWSPGVAWTLAVDSSLLSRLPAQVSLGSSLILCTAQPSSQPLCCSMAFTRSCMCLKGRLLILMIHQEIHAPSSLPCNQPRSTNLWVTESNKILFLSLPHQFRLMHKGDDGLSKKVPFLHGCFPGRG